MDILLVSGRSRDRQPHPTREQAADLARDLASSGHRVRWLCPVERGGGPAVQLPPGADFRPVVTRAPRFRAVLGTSDDTPTDRVLTEEIRLQLPDVVHVLAFGGANSSVAPWIANRMGAPVVASVDPRELLCHRGTLIDDTGEPCAVWDRGERCAACCLSPFEAGLTRGQARRGRRLAFLGRWSPYPQPHAFQGRLSLLMGGLVSATLVTVRDEAQRALLEQAGVRRGSIRVANGPGPDELLAIYGEARSAYSP